MIRPVFLSHSSKNLSEVERLDATLRQHAVPLWRDRTDLAKGVRTEDEIERAASECVGFVFYLTVEAVESKWVRVRELG